MQPRGAHAALLQADGTVIVAGGTTGGALLASVEQSDPVTAGSMLLFPTATGRYRP